MQQGTSPSETTARRQPPRPLVLDAGGFVGPLEPGRRRVQDGAAAAGVALHALARTVAGLELVRTLPWLLGSLPIGALVDRLDRRGTMVLGQHRPRHVRRGPGGRDRPRRRLALAALRRRHRDRDRRGLLRHRGPVDPALLRPPSAARPSQRAPLRRRARRPGVRRSTHRRCPGRRGAGAVVHRLRRAVGRGSGRAARAPRQLPPASRGTPDEPPRRCPGGAVLPAQPADPSHDGAHGRHDEPRDQCGVRGPRDLRRGTRVGDGVDRATVRRVPRRAGLRRPRGRPCRRTDPTPPSAGPARSRCRSSR